MADNHSSSAGSRLQLSLLPRRSESPAWTWLAALGLTGAVILGVVGIPSADIHGPLHYAGIMDPLCGATRSVYLIMRGQWQTALRYNPAAPLILVVAAGWVLRAVAGWFTGRWVHLRVPRRALIAALVVSAVALQVRQQSIASMLIAPWTSV